MAVAYSIVYPAPLDAPVEMYFALHEAVNKEVGTSVEGLLVHLARRTTQGFEVIEVWESKEYSDKFQREVGRPVIERIAGPDAPALEPESFDLLGLVVSKGDVFI